MATKKLASIKRRVESATVEATGKTPILDNVDTEDLSYRLGVDLFGAEAKVVAQNDQAKLSALEAEIESLVKDVKQNGVDGGVGTDTTDENTTTNDDNIAPLSASQIIAESQFLYGNIRFLQACSAARASLDESVTLSTPELAPQMETQPVRSAELFLQAAASLHKAETILEKAAAANSNHAVSNNNSQQQQKRLEFAYEIVDSIHTSLRRHKLDLIRTATTALADHISTIDTVTHRFSVRRGAEHGQALDVLQLLAQHEGTSNNHNNSSTLQRVLHDFCHRLSRDVFAPILHSHRNGSPMIVTASSQASAPLHRWSKKVVQELEWSWDADETTTTIDHMAVWSSTFQFLQQVLEFTAEYVLLGRKELCAIAGRKLFGKHEATTAGSETCCDAEPLWKVDEVSVEENGSLLEPLLHALEETCIPTHLLPSELHRLKDTAGQLQAILEPFLSMVQERAFASEGLEPLTTFGGSFEAKYVLNRQRLHLSEARTILLESDYHSTVQVGEIPPESKCKLPIEEDEAVFLLHRSSISSTAFQIIQKCRSILDEAVALPKNEGDGPLYTMPMKLRGTAREALDLYRSIIPVAHGEEIATMPRTAAIMHNDCVYFSHHCLTLGMEYGEANEPTAEEEDGDDDKESRVRLENFFFADMVPLFRKLADQSMCRMLDVLAGQIMEKVDVSTLSQSLDSKAIVSVWSEAEVAVDKGVRQLQHLSTTWAPVLATNIRKKSLTFLSDVLMGVILEQVLAAKTFSPAAIEFLQALFSKTKDQVCRSILSTPPSSHVWSRWVAVHRLLQRHALAAGLSEGVFESLTTKELCGLVQAVFADDPQRQRLLERLDGRGGATSKTDHMVDPSTATEGGES